MSIESKIALYGSLIVICIVSAIVMFSPAPNPAEREAGCRLQLAMTTDRSLEEIASLCKQL